MNIDDPRLLYKLAGAAYRQLAPNLSPPDKEDLIQEMVLAQLEAKERVDKDLNPGIYLYIAALMEGSKYLTRRLYPWNNRRCDIHSRLDPLTPEEAGPETQADVLAIRDHLSMSKHGKWALAFLDNASFQDIANNAGVSRQYIAKCVLKTLEVMRAYYGPGDQERD